MAFSKAYRILWDIPEDLFKQVAQASPTLADMYRTLGLEEYNYRSCIKLLRTRCLELGIAYPNYRVSGIRSGKFRTDEEVFSNPSPVTAPTVKSRLIKKDLIPYICSECKVVNTYNNKPIMLQLDHINGDKLDNRLNNLRFLCPNCHSQTDTYMGRNIGRTGITYRSIQEKICKNCKKPYPTKRIDSIFCNQSCRSKWSNRTI